MIFSLYLPILLSLSLSFLLHAFKKHIRSFFSLLTTNNHKLHLKCQHHNAIDNYAIVLDSATVAEEAAEKPSVPPPPPIGLIDDCIDEKRVDVQIDDDDNENNDEDEDRDDYCWRRMGMAEGRRNWRNEERFPPPISSLNGNGQRNFVLVPMRTDGRLQLSKVRIKRPEIMHATRQDGRLRLFLVPDQRIQEDDVDEEQELLEEVAEETEEEMLVESESESGSEEEKEEEEEEEGMVEESRYDVVEEEEDWINGEWNKYHSEGFRRCHHYYHHHHHVHGSYNNLLMFGVC